MSEAISKGRPAGSERGGSLMAVAGLAAVTLALFGEFLFGAGNAFPSHGMGDTGRYYVPARGFAVEQLLQGNLPLWNPHTFSGTPFVGVFQSSVLYPLNIIYLALPLPKAISLEFAMHLFLLGFFVYSWLRGRGLHALAAFFSAVSVMLSGSCFLRVLAGALSVIDTLVWVPLLLLCIDRLAERASLGWTLAGVAATSMMILAGHPPTLFMAAVAAGLYCVPVLLGSHQRLRLAGRLACLAVIPVFISAIQLWTGLQVAAEGTRNAGMSYAFATSYSFPPESLLTLLVPGFFGDGVFTYVGRWFYWDASAYIGLISFIFAVYGAMAGRGELRKRALVLAMILAVLSLGRYTPLYELLYHAVPGFSYIRAPSKFMFFTTLFTSALTAIGIDRLLRERSEARRAAALAIVIATLLSLLGLWVWLSSSNNTSLASPTRLLASLEGFQRMQPARLSRWNATLQRGLITSVMLAAGMAGLLWLARSRRWALRLVVAVGVMELLVFAYANRGAQRVEILRHRLPVLVETYERAGTNRVLEARRGTNVAMRTGGYNLWGYDPITLVRYEEFIAFTQGREVAAMNNIGGKPPNRVHPLLAMLRLEFRVKISAEVDEHPRPLPRFLLLGKHRVLSNRETIFAAMLDPGFDARRNVILEQEPDPLPAGTASRGRIELLDESTDHLSLEVELDAPAILLITDAFSPGWRAVALDGSVQSEYQVLPANYVLRAVPLMAGRHRLRLLYSPLAYRAGAWSTGVSCFALLMATAYWCLQRRRRASTSPCPSRSIVRR
ncbi:MAG: YfhO family protein [Deltaproteobacteria bacterium]|nr:YfhO family protein [Deltaproteobacteria bacterium]